MHDVVLAVHSYAGMLGTAVADRMAARLNHLVYVDAVVPKPGESWSSTHASATREARLAAAQASPEFGFAAPDPAVFGLDGGGPRVGAAAPDAASGPHLPGAAAVRPAPGGRRAAHLRRLHRAAPGHHRRHPPPGGAIRTSGTAPGCPARCRSGRAGRPGTTRWSAPRRPGAGAVDCALSRVRQEPCRRENPAGSYTDGP